MQLVPRWLQGFVIPTVLLTGALDDCTRTLKLRSVHPIYQPGDLTYDPRLVGAWESRVDPETGVRLAVFIQSLGGGSYESFKYDLGYGSDIDTLVQPARFHLARVGDHLFTDHVEEEGGPDNLAGSPMHVIQLLDVAGDTLRIFELSPDRLGNDSAWQSDPVQRFTSDGDIYLRGSTQGIQAFLLRYAADRAALGQPWVLYRKHPAPQQRFEVVQAWRASQVLSRGTHTVIHVGRTDSAFKASHLPGAQFLPAGSLIARRGDRASAWPRLSEVRRALEAAGATDGRPVLLTGDAGEDSTWEPVGRAFVALRRFGVEDIFVYDGSADSLPLETGPAAPAGRGTLAGPPDTSALISTAELRARLGQPGLVIVDVRDSLEFVGAVAARGVRRPGRVPGAQRFSLDNADPEASHVVYGGDSLVPDFIFMLLTVLGFQVRLYEPSFLEWSRHPDLPIATGEPADP